MALNFSERYFGKFINLMEEIILIFGIGELVNT